jgi:tocopherol cyclase
MSSLPNAILDTPHRAYHWPGGLLQSRQRRFFEGWYYRVSLPERGESFAFMYAIGDPAGGLPTSNGFVQVLAPKDGRCYSLIDNVEGFWGSPRQLGFGHWQKPVQPSYFVAPERFFETVYSGYQATDTLNQGVFTDDATQETVRWHYRIRPMVTWGRTDRSLATMGWLSYLSVFEPGWQILMIQGLAEGWIEWQGERFAFENAPAYSEKNWGGAFPLKWFWVQANCFANHPDVALVAGGGLRGVLWWFDSVAMVSFAYGGKFYRFMPGESQVSCAVEPWGHWQIEAVSDRHRIIVTGTIAPEGGIPLLAPTLEGPRFVCRDTLLGHVRVQLSTKSGKVLFDDTTALGGLETGGGPWDGTWTFTC